MVGQAGESAGGPRGTGPALPVGGAPAWRDSVGASLLFALLLVPLVLGALWSFPTWDDGLFYFQLNEVGPQVFKVAQGSDRPLMGWLLTALAERGVLWPIAVVLHALTWFGTGLITERYWRALFPGQWRVGRVVACLSMAPVLVQTQLVMVYPVFTAHFGCVLAFAACLAASDLGSRSGFRQSTRAVVVTLLALLIFGSALISEYAAMATVAAVLTLGLGVPTALGEAQTRRQRTALGMLGATAVVAYGIYHMTASAAARPEVRPEIQLATRGLRPFLELPVRLPFALWAGSLGELFNGFGSVMVFSGSVWGIVFGGALSMVGYFGFRTAGRAGGSEHQGLPLRPIAALMVALAVGLTAIILMSGSPQRNIGSRTWISLFPLAACLGGAVIYTLVRRRFHFAVSMACLFLSGYLCANAAAAALSIRRATDQLGPRIHERLAPDGLTVAVFLDYPTNPYVGSPIARPYELTARVARSWSPQDQKRFWAAAYNWAPLKGFVSPLPGACGMITRVEADVGGWARRGPVAKVLWVSHTTEGSFRIEESSPTCAVPEQ